MDRLKGKVILMSGGARGLSDESAYITGAEVAIDGGATL